MKKVKALLHRLFYLVLILTASVVALIILLNLADKIVPAPNIKPEYGITFSSIYAKYLGLNPEEVYEQILIDLKVKKIRLPVYWDQIEVIQGTYDFSELDKMLDLTNKNSAQVILALGYKVPRWPECYPPAWANNLTTSQREQKILNLIEATVNHFKSRNEVIAWQVENEPTVDFGECTLNSVSFLEQEIKLVKSLDTRPVITTDSGELSYWVIPMQQADLMGTTLYRRVYDKYLGYTSYPYPPLFYRLKQSLVKNIFAKDSKGTFISELQAEPWPPAISLTQMELGKQAEIFTLQQFQDNIKFAQQTGFSPTYLWGAEWWYYMKIQGYPEYWDYAKSLFSN